MLLLQHSPVFLSHHLSKLAIFLPFYVSLSLFVSPLLTFSFDSSFCSPLSVPVFPQCHARLADLDCVNVLNQHAPWGKPLLLTTACSQWADIGVSFCEQDLARAFRWDSWPSLPASSVLSSHTHTRSYLLSCDKPGQSLLGWFRCGGNLVTDITVRTKHLPCNHLFMVEWKLLAFHTLLTTCCTPIFHSAVQCTRQQYYWTAALHVAELTAARRKGLKGISTGFLECSFTDFLTFFCIPVLNVCSLKASVPFYCETIKNKEH